MYTDTQSATPRVSVIMPAYNAEAFIAEAIQSVLAQTVSDLELIVINDRATDSTQKVIEELAKTDDRIKPFINPENMGVARTRNRGIDMAKGKYIAFLDSDDVWHPQKLERQIAKMEEADADLCYCAYAIIDKDSQKTRADYLVSHKAVFKDILKENYIQCSAMLIRAEVVKKYMFNTEFYHEDYILGLDILKDGHKAVGCTEILLNWRYLENSRSFNKKKAAKNRWKIYRQYLHLSVFRAGWLFAGYAMAGVRKYFRKPQ